MNPKKIKKILELIILQKEELMKLFAINMRDFEDKKNNLDKINSFLISSQEDLQNRVNRNIPLSVELLVNHNKYDRNLLRLKESLLIELELSKKKVEFIKKDIQKIEGQEENLLALLKKDADEKKFFKDKKEQILLEDLFSIQHMLK